MYYFVIGTDGRRYGPADVDTLVQWAREGRIIASTMLIERGTDRQLRADCLTAIAVVLERLSGGKPAVVIERGEAGAAHWQPATQTAQPMPARQAAGAYPAPPPSEPIVQPAYAPVRRIGPKSKIVAGLLGLFLGGLGAHRFYLGYTSIGIVQLILTILTCGVAWTWGFIEGIICLCGGMRDADGFELHD